MSSSNLEEFLVSTEIPLFKLDCSKAWKELTENEKLYAHYLSRASWEGNVICFEQISSESPSIYRMFQNIFETISVNDLRVKSQGNNVSEENFKHFLTYVVMFYGNMGNYKSFGDSKFIPRLSKEDFETIVTSSGSQESIQLWSSIKDKVYSLNENEKFLGIPPKGVTTYYSENITLEDIELVQEVLNELKIEAYNNRLFRLEDGTLNIVLASIEKKEVNRLERKGRTIVITSGDYSEILTKVVENLEQSMLYASNENQKEMIKHYIKHFRYGDIKDHKEAQKSWVKDIGPVVESNIGFIESYRDPFGVRGEFEGLVSIVDKVSSEKFGHLVNNAEVFISHLPWPKEYEKDKFLKPDFTSLEVITFSGSGIPGGINIPNYDDIRQDFGFKNVSLGNVLRASKSNERITFIRDADQEVYQKNSDSAFEVQVGIHELLGHGSGKLFVESVDGSLNFDKSIVNPLTNKPIDSWYKGGETYDSVFSTFASSMEECRAECAGIYLCLNRDLLKIFSHEGSDADDIIYTNWLLMARAGLVSLEFYNPDSKKWGQAHMQARFSILKTLLNAGEGLVSIEEKDDNLEIHLDRTKIETVGKKAIGDYILKLQVYKSTGDLKNAESLYMDTSGVNEDLLKYREIVLKNKKPRRQFVQARTKIIDGKVELLEFDATEEGMIESFKVY